MALCDQVLIGVFILMGYLVQGHSAQTTNFSYVLFNSPENFSMVGDTYYYPDTTSFLLNPAAYSLNTRTQSCAQLYYRDKIRMKDKATGAVASFQTAFTFEITGLNYRYDASGWLHGDGIAFTFAANQTPWDGGGSLCLLKDANDGQTSNRMFAVEFDTFRNTGFNDTSNNHIGVNVNSMVSKSVYNLCGGNVPNCTYLVGGGSFTAWVDYNDSAQKLDVYFANGTLFDLVRKPAKPLIETTLSLTELVDEYMYVGFRASVSSYNEVHHVHGWQFTSFGMPAEQIAAPPPRPDPPAAGSTARKASIIAGACAGALVMLLLLGFLFAWYRRKVYSSKHVGTKFSLVDQNLMPRMFTYKELSKATKNFSRSELLGSGGFGAVYRGTLPSGSVVAVKRMIHQTKHGEEGIQAEAASLSQIRHRNLVQLRGWCHEEDQLLLVYDFLCNGSLDEWLHRFEGRKAGKGPFSNTAEALPLQLRHSIVSGVAAALFCLHEECKQCVLHRDIKSSNVLLDEDLNVYLGDFGLARLIDHQKMEKTTMMAGTLGYMAPEMPTTLKATKESDVYSFGVLLLEVICGVRPLDVSAIERGDGTLVDRVWRAHTTGSILLVADEKLGTFPPDDLDSHEASSLLLVENVSFSAAMEDKKLVVNLLQLGLLCCNPNPEDRPSMRLVSQLLQAPEPMDTAMPAVPRCKPHANYSAPGFSRMKMIRSPASSSYGDSSVEVGRGSSSQSTPPSSVISMPTCMHLLQPSHQQSSIRVDELDQKWWSRITTLYQNSVSEILERFDIVCAACIFGGEARVEWCFRDPTPKSPMHVTHAHT